MNKKQSDLSQFSAFRLGGYLNPFGIKPVFLIPVFEDKIGQGFIQIADDEERILTFAPCDKETSKHVIRRPRRIFLKKGDPVIHAFIFDDDDDVHFGSRQQLSNILRARKSEISTYPFVYTEILDFIGEAEKIYREIPKIRNILSFSNKELAKEWALIEINSLRANSECPEINIEPFGFKHADDQGLINFWELEDEIHNLLNTYDQIYVRLKRVRSQASLCPELRNLLKGFGIFSKKIDSEGKFVPVDKHCFNALKGISKISMIVEVIVFGDQIISITPTDPTSIKKKYFKRNPKKIVKNKSARDYICNVIIL